MVRSDPEKVRVLLVDDYEIVRVGLSSLLSFEDDMVVAGDAANGGEAIAAALRLVPDVVVLDVRLPDMSGVEVCREIKTSLPSVEVLMLTSFADDEAYEAAFAAGAAGFLLKQVHNDDLLASIRKVARGSNNPSREPGERVTDRHGGSRCGLLDRLSPREAAVAHYLAEGMTNGQIAAEMSLAEKTIKNYVSNVLAKMNMARRSEVAAYVAKCEARSATPDVAVSWEEAGLELVPV